MMENLSFTQEDNFFLIFLNPILLTKWTLNAI